MVDSSDGWLRVLDGLLSVQSLVMAVVLGYLLGSALRSLLVLVLDKGQSRGQAVWRVLAALLYGGCLAGYWWLVGSMVTWNFHTMLWAGGTALLMVLGFVLLRLLLGHVYQEGLVATLLKTVALLAAVLLALLSVMRAGYLNLTTDRPLLVVDVTGETRAQTVRWAAPDQPMQERALRAHRVVLRTPQGQKVSEEWLYGDQVAIKGQVLRLHPLLNAMGVSNLFELQFVHNGYLTAERHNSEPHLARPLVVEGTLAAPDRLVPLRDRLLGWLKTRPKDSHLAVQTLTSESTYFPLHDPQGQPTHRTFDLVLTPGGLTAR
ncbi:MAG: hypothetical protein JNM83_11775 [Myxococcales bacterium]|nr:hypothetical protein [Myxococcales bacterium]